MSIIFSISILSVQVVRYIVHFLHFLKTFLLVNFLAGMIPCENNFFFVIGIVLVN